MARNPGFGNRFVTNDTVLARMAFLRKASLVKDDSTVATFAEVEKTLTDVMRGAGDDEEISKIEDYVDEIQSPEAAATVRVKIADMKIRQKKVRLSAAETLARTHGAFDPKGTGTEDTAQVVEKILAGLMKSGIKPQDFMDLLNKKKQKVIDVEPESVPRDGSS